MGLEGVEAREGGEQRGEVVLGLRGRIRADGHEDGQPVEGGGDGLGGRGGRVLRVNEVGDGPCVVPRVRAEGLEGEQEGYSPILVSVFRGREPVGESGHVQGRDGEDVEEALVAPGGEEALEGLRVGRVVEAQDGVGDAEVDLALGRGREEVARGEVPVVVREGLGELEGQLAGREGLVARGGLVQLEQLLDAGRAGLADAGVGNSEGREPLEVALVGGRGRGERLGVGRRRLGGLLVLVVEVARLREEPGVLAQDLEVLLPNGGRILLG